MESSKKKKKHPTGLTRQARDQQFLEKEALVQLQLHELPLEAPSLPQEGGLSLFKAIAEPESEPWD